MIAGSARSKANSSNSNGNGNSNNGVAPGSGSGSGGGGGGAGGSGTGMRPRSSGQVRQAYLANLGIDQSSQKNALSPMPNRQVSQKRVGKELAGFTTPVPRSKPPRGQ